MDGTVGVESFGVKVIFFTLKFDYKKTKDFKLYYEIKNLKVLIVDDNASSERFLKILLNH